MVSSIKPRRITTAAQNNLGGNRNITSTSNLLWAGTRCCTTTKMSRIIPIHPFRLGFHSAKYLWLWQTALPPFWSRKKKFKIITFMVHLMVCRTSQFTVRLFYECRRHLQEKYHSQSVTTSDGLSKNKLSFLSKVTTRAAFSGNFQLRFPSWGFIRAKKILLYHEAVKRSGTP